ncbi:MULTISPECIES: hypothetical protein [unclassified Sulfitobacter]|uniref:hypothetical protein n=1 Tax=unclassified Sulfitobacter TaxID=196795 RepID=UPI00374690D9
MSWVQWAHNQNLQNDISAYQRALWEAKQERDELWKKLRDAEYLKEQWKTHYTAEQEVRNRAMEELDKASGGADKNLLRAQAYADPDAFRIPKGPREGEVVTKADHIFLSKFRDLYQKHYESKWKFCKKWTDFINKNVSI